ncbi:MAG: hypothetical protein JWO36_4926 [Myxococcales bacterium]|nr:hypothetical protein [Myxococcales bacterium]
MRWLAALVLVVSFGCAKKREAEPVADDRAPMMPADEVQRSRDACAAYVEKACACADKVPAAKQACDLSHALPEAVRISLEVAASPDSTKSDGLSAQRSVRKTVKECIEQTAKLPMLGCP